MMTTEKNRSEEFNFYTRNDVLSAATLLSKNCKRHTIKGVHLIQLEITFTKIRLLNKIHAIRRYVCKECTQFLSGCKRVIPVKKISSFQKMRCHQAQCEGLIHYCQ